MTIDDQKKMAIARMISAADGSREVLNPREAMMAVAMCFGEVKIGSGIVMICRPNGEVWGFSQIIREDPSKERRRSGWPREDNPFYDPSEYGNEDFKGDPSSTCPHCGMTVSCGSVGVVRSPNGYLYHGGCYRTVKNEAHEARQAVDRIREREELDKKKEAEEQEKDSYLSALSLPALLDQYKLVVSQRDEAAREVHALRTWLRDEIRFTGKLQARNSLLNSALNQAIKWTEKTNEVMRSGEIGSEDFKELTHDTSELRRLLAPFPSSRVDLSRALHTALNMVEDGIETLRENNLITNARTTTNKVAELRKLLDPPQEDKDDV